MRGTTNIKFSILFIQCVTDKFFATLNQQNARTYSLGIYIIISHSGWYCNTDI